MAPVTATRADLCDGSGAHNDPYNDADGKRAYIGPPWDGAKGTYTQWLWKLNMFIDSLGPQMEQLRKGALEEPWSLGGGACRHSGAPGSRSSLRPTPPRRRAPSPDFEVRVGTREGGQAHPRQHRSCVPSAGSALTVGVGALPLACLAICGCRRGAAWAPVSPGPLRPVGPHPSPRVRDAGTLRGWSGGGTPSTCANRARQSPAQAKHVSSKQEALPTHPAAGGVAPLRNTAVGPRSGPSPHSITA